MTDLCKWCIHQNDCPVINVVEEACDCDFKDIEDAALER